ncbi:ESX secretion-associated protein EspG [Nocardia vinacea]|uniref:ESX secretion-associated protein EspG n=1 Tax=Nocardia vinacea TaxID=96468 RepID=A0ABZ1YXI9_9NOCA|nr:ESX secretion-associated protein EspG [Nocardia vinacea]
MTEMTNDAVLAVSNLLQVQTLPTVLGIGPQQDSIADWAAAQQAALAGLRDSGVIDEYDDVDSDLTDALRILAHPERELAARIYTEFETRRFCLARNGTRHAVAVRTGDLIEIRTVWADEGPAVARPVLDLLGPCTPAEITGFSAVSAELRERLDQASDATDYAQIAYSYGLDDRQAIDFGLTLSSCHAHAEIVAYAHEGGVTTRAPGAVAVYDTARGRLCAGPATAGDQQTLSTFAPGSDHRIAQSICAMIESLPGGRWMP